jgi:hypothetical protein
MPQNLVALINDYFDELTCELDLRIERLIRDNCNDEELTDNINEVRDTFLAEILACQAQNLTRFTPTVRQPAGGRSKWEDDDDDGDEEKEPLFTSFCFFIHVCADKSVDAALTPCYINCQAMAAAFIDFRLIVVDKYLTRAQIRCFEELLKFTPNSLFGIKEKQKDLLFDVMPGVSL